MIDKHLDWSAKQRRILTADGRADELYTKERGFDFDMTELPHYFLMQGDTRRVFGDWQKTMPTAPSPIVGAWERALFCGDWEHSTSDDERTYNLQTATLFIDLRIPLSRSTVLDCKATSLKELNGEQLRYYARQHIFAGYSRIESADDAPHQANCARHHCIDWNFVGQGRSRPNKWWIDRHADGQRWKEWAYATSDNAQHYYMERWERLEGGAASPLVALRKTTGRDGVLVIVGDHFNYCLDRQIKGKGSNEQKNVVSLVELVDQAIAKDDLDTARSWLSMQGGHGRISTGWTIDCAIEFWREGSVLWTRDEVSVVGERITDCSVQWKSEEWRVFECNLASVQDLEQLLTKGLDA